MSAMAGIDRSLERFQKIIFLCSRSPTQDPGCLGLFSLLETGRQRVNRSHEENKKKFWKEVGRVRKGGSRTEETVKDVNVRLLRGSEARKRCAEYFEELLNVQEDREADIVAVGGIQLPVMGEANEREITREEVKRALNETKGGKTPGLDGV